MSIRTSEGDLVGNPDEWEKRMTDKPMTPEATVASRIFDALVPYLRRIATDDEIVRVINAHTEALQRDLDEARRLLAEADAVLAKTAEPDGDILCAFDDLAARITRQAIERHRARTTPASAKP